jgi:RHS repeat-associated protein
MWNRLASATATNGSWGDAYAFDGFGNLTGKTPTAGSAPAMNVPANPATNQPSGAGYDANGNPQSSAYSWDIENRLVMSTVNSATTNYTYDPWGRRMWKEVPGGRDSNGNPLPTPCEIYFYGATGQKLETYSCLTNSSGFYSTLEGINIYFGGKLLQAKGVWVATDRLGSVRANSNGETFSYFPYGEERTSTADGREKFATYTRDGFGQDYAQQRYYNANVGAFWSPDPGGIKTANPKNLSSWNRYGYTKGNPIGRFDPHGLEDCDPDDDDGCCDSDGCCDDDPNDPECQLPAGGGPGPQKPTKRKHGPGSVPVTKSYNIDVPYDKSASGLMGDVEGNFASFGNYTGSFDGLSTTLSFNVPSGGISTGSVIQIPHTTLGITLNDSVTVTQASATSFTFATNPAHPLDATISFTAQDMGNGFVGFSVSIAGQTSNGLWSLFFGAGGSSFEDSVWNNFLNQVTAD